MGRNLGPLNIKDSYEGLVQISGSQLTDGSGSLISNLSITASDATSATSASYAVTASFAENAGTPTLQEVTDEGNTSTNNITIVNAQNRTYAASSITSNTAGGTYIISGGTAAAALALSGNGGNDNVIRVNPAFGVEITGSTAFKDEITIDSTAAKTLVTKGGIEISSSTAPTLEIQSTTASLDPSVLFQSGSTYVGFVAGTSTALEIGDFANNRVKVSGSSLEVDVALTASGLNYPTADGSNGDVLTTDGAGNLTLQPSAGGAAFPYTGSAEITGSLGITGSFSVSGSGGFVVLNEEGIAISPDQGLSVPNMLIGSRAGRNITTGTQNTIIGPTQNFGQGAGDNLTSGVQNVIIGAAAGASLNAANNNVIIGHGNLQIGTNTNINDNVYIGDGVVRDVTSGGGNVRIGKWSGYNASGASNAVSIGYRSGWKDIGSHNIFIGENVQGQNATSFFSDNYYLAIGSDNDAEECLIYGNHEEGGSNRFLQVTGDLRVTGSTIVQDFTASGLNYPTADGSNGDVLTTDGAGNLTLQPSAGGAAFPFTGDAVITGSLLISGSKGLEVTGPVDLNNRATAIAPSGSDPDNVLIGPGAGEDITTGVRNVCIGGEIFGVGAGESLTTGNENILIGAGAGRLMVSNNGNVALGNNTFFSANNVTDTTALGKECARDANNMTTGVMVGKWSGYGASGNNLIAIGYRSGWKNSGNNNIFIGENVVGQTVTTFSNSYYLAIGSDVNAEDNLLYGYHGTDSTPGDRFLTVDGLINAGQYSSAPTGAGVQAGSIYYDTSTNKLRCYDGTSWNDLF